MTSYIDTASGTAKTEPRLEPHAVYGGYRISVVTWERTEAGWEPWYEDAAHGTLYPTQAACSAAIAARGAP